VTERAGSGPGAVTILRPADLTEDVPVVLFLHGWGATELVRYRPWLEHLAHAGNAVLYPRYQDSFAEPPAQVLGNVVVGVRLALERLDEDPGSLVVAGHSAGGALAADYAAVAGGVGLPVPRAVFAAYPGRRFARAGVGIPPAGEIPPGTEVLALRGADDRVVDQAAAREIGARGRLLVIRTAGARDHLAPQRDDAVSRREFWARLDALIARARG
jgi:pimeloyl-ACP methyl ester carboxylesterase